MGFLEMLHIRHEMKRKIKILFTRRRLNVQQIIKTYACLTGGSPFICIKQMCTGASQFGILSYDTPFKQHTNNA